MATKNRLKAIRSLWYLLFSNESKCYAIKAQGIYYNILSLSDKTMEVKWGNSPYKGDVTISSSIRCRNKTYRVTSIGESAFEECHCMTSVTILDGISRIGNLAFRNCTSLNYVNMPPSITSIGKASFFNCNKLKDICIPERIVSIGREAFNGCNSLCHLYLRPTTPPVCENDTFDAASFFTCTLHVPPGTSASYREDPVWGHFFSIEEISVSLCDEKNQGQLKLSID